MSNGQFTIAPSIIALQRPLCFINFLNWDFGFDLEFELKSWSSITILIALGFIYVAIEAYFRFNSNVFPVTLKLLKSMAHTAIRGVNSPLMAMGMLMMLYNKENTKF
jgi:hypothetical protein